MNGDSTTSDRWYTTQKGTLKGGWLLLLVIGLILTGYGGYMYIDNQSQVQRFEPTSATIVDSFVDKYRRTDKPDRYVPKITYEYTVDGETYQSSSVFPTQRFLDKGDAGNIVRDYPNGAEVSAYYNPDKPSESYLIRSSPPWKQILGSTAVGGLLLVAGVVSLIRRVRD